MSPSQSVSASPHFLPSNPQLAHSTSFFKGLKLTLNNMGRKAQSFLAKWTCGLVRSPSRDRSAADFMRAPPALNRTRSTVSDADMANTMEKNAGKRKKLDSWLTARNEIIQEVSAGVLTWMEGKESPRPSPVRVRGEGAVMRCPTYERVLVAQEMFRGFGKCPSRELRTFDLARYDPQMLLLKTHFEANFAVPEEPLDLNVCRKMEEAYFRIFDKLLTAVSGKRCDMSRCGEIFIGLRREALMHLLSKVEGLDGERISALMQQYKDDFEKRLSGLTETEKNNPFLLQAAHCEVQLKPWSDTGIDIAGLNRALKRRAPSAYLLSRMGMALIAMADKGDLAALAQGSTPPLLPPLRIRHKFALLREQALENALDRIGNAAPAEVAFGDETYLCLTTPEEDVEEKKRVQEFARLFERNQMAFLARVESMEGMESIGVDESRENARKSALEMHFDMPLLRSDMARDSANPQFLNTVEDVQAALSERMIIAGVESEVGLRREAIPSGEIRRLFRQYVEREKMDAFAFSPFDEATRPAALLARAAERTIAEISGNIKERIARKKAAREAAGEGDRVDGVAGKILAELEAQKRHFPADDRKSSTIPSKRSATPPPLGADRMRSYFLDY